MQINHNQNTNKILRLIDLFILNDAFYSFLLLNY
jgi:hypothetical protein